jgi:uncharacterized iron-regulated membrane protein
MRWSSRAALFRLHAWVGLGTGLYIGVMSLSGSALLFYPELYRALAPRPAIALRANRLSRVQLKDAAQKRHPGAEVTWIWERKKPPGLVEIWMTDGNKQTERLFNAFTGDDLGSAVPFSIRALNALKDFHTNFLPGRAGQILNAAGALLISFLSISGIWLLWPGIGRRVFKGYRTRPAPSEGRAHRTIGFWTLPFVLMAGATGLVLALEKLLSPPQSLVSLSYLLHTAGFGGWPIRFLWVLLSLAGPLLVVTGATIWSIRVRRSMSGARLRASQSYFAGPLSS